MTCYFGDCRQVMQRLIDEGVKAQMCVTSPPYFGLRDYGVDGQIGLEETPNEYVANLVEVFRMVRELLADDGTLWLNLGDSYAANRTYQVPSTKGGPKHSPSQGFEGSAMRVPDGLKQKDLIGIPWRVAFALQQPWVDWQIKDEAMRAWVAGIVDGEGCITILETKSSHSESLSYPPIVQVRMCDLDPLERLVDVAGSSYGEPQHPPSQVVAKQRQSWQWKITSSQAAKIIAEIYPYLTCKRKQAIVAWNHQLFRAKRGNQKRAKGDIEKEQFCKKLINDLNQRKPVDLPSWMLEPAVTKEPGWYLRQDLIWSKPNPMPESVRDRCTKAHEYLFLLSKSPRYYFDQEAIKETGTNKACGNTGPGKYKNAPLCDTKQRKHLIPASDTRNKRSVWTVTTKPYPDAHFAVFPPALIEPCILAGSRTRDVVLDPFLGSGTTAAVAEHLGRNWIGVELNPAYETMQRERLGQQSLAL